MKYIVSACLMGDNCKYNGGNNYNPKVVEFLKDKDYIKVCPECLGGLKVPRFKSEIKGNRVINEKNDDVTKNFIKGSLKVLEIVKKNKIKKAILKSKSPSCGFSLIYDGTFSNKLIEGNGITTDILLNNNIEVISSESEDL